MTFWSFLYSTVISVLTLTIVNGQDLPIPNDIGKKHPRCYGRQMDRDSVRTLVDHHEWARNIIEHTTLRLDPYIKNFKTDSTWLTSRLQMFWNSKCTHIFINGGKYSHAEGRAPVPTIKFPGTRDFRTEYRRPALADVLPFMDDERGVWLQHKTTAEWKWVPIVESGRLLESINYEIVGLAKDASFLYWYTQDEVYARLAFGVLDTYLSGLYHREEPIDLSHGHHQTLVGFTTFEVIQEHYIKDVTVAYDFLYQYIEAHHRPKIGVFTDALRKWTDQMVKNGVSFNNWNLIEANHMLCAGLVLENNDYYSDGRGAQYYLEKALNESSPRQWSVRKLIDYGYDKGSGIWNESPGYSMLVLKDFMRIAQFYDRNFDIDLIKEISILRKAVIASVQYLYPNRFQVAFGDGHYGKLSSDPLRYMISNSQKYHKSDDEIYFTKMFKTLFPDEIQVAGRPGNDVEDLFQSKTWKLRDDVLAGKLEDFTTRMFYASKPSWIVQRQGSGETGLMISQVASNGNHMHSNGIAMELYGYGLPLSPEMGHGSSYFSIEYAEYYSQFPAHNTVVVNGRSKYPEMKSNHPFVLRGCYPASGDSTVTMDGITYSDVEFLEPETNSRQRRIMGIVKADSSGYYVDIFRSKQIEENDVKHEYFFHNLGHSLELFDAVDRPLILNPTSKLAFADGDLMGYDYLWDKKSIQTDQDFKGVFHLKTPGRTVSMNLFVRGESGREIFSALSPRSTAFRHGLLPESLNELPIPTMVIRQSGEAWDRPFVAIYEPFLNGKSAISKVDYFADNGDVGIHVVRKNGEDFIFSSYLDHGGVNYRDVSVTGAYGVISKSGDRIKFFLDKGTLIAKDRYKMMSVHPCTMAISRENDEIAIFSSNEFRMSIPLANPKRKYCLVSAEGKTYYGKNNKQNQVTFDLPRVNDARFRIEERK